MPAFIDLELGGALVAGDVRIEIVKKHGRRVRLKVDAPESVKLATVDSQANHGTDHGAKTNTALSRMSATALNRRR